MDRADLEQLADAIAFEVNLREMPCPRNPTPSGGPGYYWTIGDRQLHDNSEPLRLAMAYFWDTWRRGEAMRLVAAAGLPADVLPLVFERLPRESVMFRLGWERWRELREANYAAAPPRWASSRSRSASGLKGLVR
jgi:hypothetical protein